KTSAVGLRVPKARGDFLVLKAIRESGGAAVAVSERAILETMRRTALEEGVLVCPETAAALASLHQLKRAQVITSSDTVVVLNTGTGLKYLHLFERAARRAIHSQRIAA